MDFSDAGFCRATQIIHYTYTVIEQLFTQNNKHTYMYIATLIKQLFARLRLAPIIQESSQLLGRGIIESLSKDYRYMYM